MSTTIARQVYMDRERATRLDQFAAAEGITPDAVIEHALDLWFQTHSACPELSDELQADWQLLRELETELGPVEVPSAPPIRPEETTFVVGTPVRGRLLRLGEPL
jgi:hypothetical protein